MFLVQRDGQDHFAFVRDRLLRHKDGSAVTVASARPVVGRPSGRHVAIDCVSNAARGPFVVGCVFVTVNARQIRQRRIHFGIGTDKFDLPLFVWFISGSYSDFEFGQCSSAVDRTSWAATRQLRMLQRVDSKRLDAFGRGLDIESVADFRRRVAFTNNGSIVQQSELLAFVR